MFCQRCGTEVQQSSQFCPTCGLDLRVTTPVQAIAGGEVVERDLVRESMSEEYELLEELGRGGMAIVYRAKDTHLEREVAIKVLPFSLAFDAEFVERFTREARTAASLEHPNIIPIYRVGKTGRVIYFAMKLIRGGSLSRQLAEQKRLPPAEIRKLLADVGSALGYAHKRGIVHRDIKPDNVMFDEFGQCVVTDFGIAKAGTSSKLTGTGMSIGTPHYMSPEQARAQSIDGRSDLYSLGIVAYQALVGEVPYDGEDSFSIGYKHIMEPIPVPLLDTSDERRLFEVIKRLIMKDPLDRFQDAEALLKALEGQPRESVAGKRPSQALLPSQAPAQVAQAIPLSPLPGPRPRRPVAPAPPVAAPAGDPATAAAAPPLRSIGADTPRRAAIRRSTATPPPPSTSWAPWVLAALLVIGFAMGGIYLYRQGQLGGKGPQPVITPPAESTHTAVTDTVVPDTAPIFTDATPFQRPVTGDSAVRQSTAGTPGDGRTIGAPDSGSLLLQGLPSGTDVLIDSRPLTQPGGSIRLADGWHEIGLSAPGYQLYRDSVLIDAGKTLILNPVLSASNIPPPPAGSPADLRRIARARLDCENPSLVNRFGRLCYDTPPQPLGSTRVPVPAGVSGTPSSVVLVVMVTQQGRTRFARTKKPSDDPAFTRAVENFALRLRWTPAYRDGRPVDGWTQAAFIPDVP
jgi:serine/threonine-protein kinase